MVALASWGRLGSWQHEVTQLHREKGLAQVLADSAPGIAYGMGRSYGDVCLNPGGAAWKTRGLNCFIHFDPASGVLECESGVLLQEIQALTVPQGWMLPVTPGTQFVTLGGAVANDVHGKNHHAMGSFGDHLQQLTLVRSDGQVIHCGPDLEPSWFAATVGGMGLTGVISRVTLALRPVLGPCLDVESVPYANLDEFFELADDSERDWEYTVSWIDCLARKSRRGIFYRANHSSESSCVARRRQGMRVPLTPPISLVNRFSLRPFNALYYHLKKSRAGLSREHYQPFFYPLDSITDWNRMYGPNGFYQYQCVLPPEQRKDGIEAILSEIACSNTGSFPQHPVTSTTGKVLSLSALFVFLI